jgi:hypothetical protein
VGIALQQQPDDLIIPRNWLKSWQWGESFIFHRAHPCRFCSPQNKTLSALPPAVSDLRFVFGRDRRNEIVSFLPREEEEAAVCLAISACVTLPAGLLREGVLLTAIRLQGCQQWFV